MARFSTTLISVSILLLSSGLQQTASAEEMVPKIEPIYIEKLPDVAAAFEFSEDGKTFILAGNHSFLYLYDAKTLEKITSLIGTRYELRIRGAGYIDSDTWYFATDHPDTKLITRFSIRQIEPQREIHQYDVPIVFGKLRTITSKDYIIHSKTMLNWRTGKTYQVDIIDDPRSGYTLTDNNQLVTRNYHGNLYLFNDPIEQKSITVDVGSPFNILSPRAQYALVGTTLGGCKLLQMPQKAHIGRCRQWGKQWGEAEFQPDNQIFAISSKNEIYVYATQPFNFLMTATMADEVVVVSLGEGRLAAQDDSGNIRVWDITKKKLLGEYRKGIGGQSHGRMNFQPHGNKLAVTKYGHLLVFDLPSAPIHSAVPAD